MPTINIAVVPRPGAAFPRVKLDNIINPFIAKTIPDGLTQGGGG